MVFGLSERPVEWIASAPVRVERKVLLCAPPEQVFSTLSDIANWTRWFKGMRRVTVDGQGFGPGALRTVWVEASRVQEHFVVWEPNRRLAFNIVACNLPGLVAMAEDWSLEDHGVGHTMLTIVVAAEPLRALHLPTGLARSVIAFSTRGAGGIATVFPCDDGAREHNTPPTA